MIDGYPEYGLTARVKELDPTRLVDSTSGWHDHGAGDFSVSDSEKHRVQYLPTYLDRIIIIMRIPNAALPFTLSNRVRTTPVALASKESLEVLGPTCR